VGILDWFEEDEHPRAPKGSPGGGKFAKKGAGGGSGGGGGGGSGKAKNTAALAYDPKSKTGTGYNTPGGDKRVKALQSVLNRLGITDGDGKPLKLDGKLGPKTDAAVKKLQQRLGLKPDGRVTPALLAKLAATKALPKRGAAVDLCVRSYDFEFRGESGDGRTLEGYAAVFNTPTRIRDTLGEFDEVILPGAFSRSLGARTPVLQWDHGRDPAVGTAPIGDIQDLREDDHGLFVRARLYDHPSTGRVRMAIAGQSVKGMSFRFGVPDKGDTWSKRTDQPDLREIRDADVHELGPVVFPAYTDTTVAVRSFLDLLTPDERRTFLHDLAAELRGAVDLSDLVGQPAPERADGDERGPEPSSGEAPALHNLRLRLDEGALRIRGILT